MTDEIENLYSHAKDGHKKGVKILVYLNAALR